jgi:hypothetical protein
MSHTPGPWEIDTAKDRDGRHHIIHGPVPNGVNPDFGYPICDTSNRHHCITPREDADNAHLLKAAPKMLFVLRYVLPLLEAKEREQGGLSAYVREVREAISEATEVE